MNQHQVICSCTFVIATILAYSLTLPVTVAYDQATDKRNASYEAALSMKLLQAQEVLALLQQTLDNQRAETTPVAVAPAVPFYSQFSNISDPSWQKVGCGIASLAMLIDHYGPAVAPDTLLQQGIAAGAYINSAGWSHAGLINLASLYGLTGESVGLAGESPEGAYQKLKQAVANGPVMVSVHYTFEPSNPIPHLAVVTAVTEDTVYYNDPAEPAGGGTITKEKFQAAWKQRYITIRSVS